MGFPRRSRFWCAAAAAVALLLPACGSGDNPENPPVAQPTHTPVPTTGLEEFYNQEITWRPCEATLECAEIAVPLDYAKPRSQKIEVAVARRKATGGNRIGSLLVNPGGPGVSGVGALVSLRGALASKPVLDSYDVVGFDPRGVGRTSPVDCVTDNRLDALLAMDGTPETPAEEKALSRARQGLASSCADRSPKILPHVGSRNTARDMDILRAVLGDEKLHYLGYSYGTYLGALYADFFPDRVGRLVLDGAIDPAADEIEVSRVQAEGFNEALRAFVQDCLPREECPLTGTPDEAIGQIAQLLRDTDIEPLPTGGEREVTESLATLGIASGLYDPQKWGFLRTALEDAFTSEGDGLLDLADDYTHRRSDGYATNLMEALAAISCTDRRGTGDVAEARRLAGDLEEVSPVFGRFVGWGALGCLGWEFPPDGEPAQVRAPGAAPILVIGTTGDPATPLRWARALADQLDSGVLLVRDGEGHLAYRMGNQCIDTIVDAYLLQGTVPENGKKCARPTGR